MVEPAEPVCFYTRKNFTPRAASSALVRQERFAVSLDRAFGPVIRACAETRLTNGQGTWITRDMVDAYCALHEAGFAHSVEVWDGQRLAGGMYGVSLGGALFWRIHVQPRLQRLQSRVFQSHSTA